MDIPWWIIVICVVVVVAIVLNILFGDRQEREQALGAIAVIVFLILGAVVTAYGFPLIGKFIPFLGKFF